MFQRTTLTLAAIAACCLAAPGCAPAALSEMTIEPIEDRDEDDDRFRFWTEYELRSCRAGVYSACEEIATALDPDPEPDARSGWGSPSRSESAVALGLPRPEPTDEHHEMIAWASQMLWLLETYLCEPGSDCEHNASAAKPDDLMRLDNGLREARRSEHKDCTSASTEGLSCVVMAEARRLPHKSEAFEHRNHYLIHACRVGRRWACEEVFKDVSGFQIVTSDSFARNEVRSARKARPKPPAKPSRPSKPVLKDSELSELGNLFGGQDPVLGGMEAALSGLWMGLDPQDVKDCKKNDPVACFDVATTDISSMPLFNDEAKADYEAAKAQKEECQARAVKLYTARCDKGDATACFHIGLMHQFRLIGLSGYQKATDAMDKACALGLAKACVGLGQLLAVKSERALASFTRACELSLQSKKRWGCAQAALHMAVVGRHKEAQGFLDLAANPRVSLAVRYWQ